MKEFDFFKFLKKNNINGIFLDEGYMVGLPGIRMIINGGVVKIYYTLSDTMNVLVFDKSLNEIESAKEVLNVINNMVALHANPKLIPEENLITLISKDVLNTQLTLTQNMLLGEIRSRDKQIDALFEVIATLIRDFDSERSNIEYGHMWSKSLSESLNIPIALKKKLGIHFGNEED